MEEKNEIDVCDDIMLPGFRFHPTDEELVDFYLKKKIQQETLPIDMIKQVDIYKYDPWDLPKMASSGSEKDLYFYCQRDRKYRNSTRPNRVTKTGFWKATGTDRPIYSSKGNCIGLKKSLVFYRGRAAKGIKTEWMMHEFRLPSLSDSSLPRNLPLKALPPSEAWAVCRIFKKAISNKPPSYVHPSFPQFPESLPASGGATVSGNISGEYFSASDGFCYKPMSINEATGTMVLNSECEGLEGVNHQFSHDMNGTMNRTVEFSFTEPSSSDVWRSTMLWDSSLFN